jgi:nicotinamidase-related amidase
LQKMKINQNKNAVSRDERAVKSKIALLLIDVISDFEFEDGKELFKFALPVAQCIAALKKRAQKDGIPVIYINDNFGNWRDDFQKIVNSCLTENVRGCEIVKLLKPEAEDYFVLKPKHSAFYSTTLDLLLEELNVETLILAGFSTDICILFTANDAYMRGYQLCVPEDCVAAVEPEENIHSLKYIERVLKADIHNSSEIVFAQGTKNNINHN